MSETFTKLFGSITDSTIWAEDHATRLVWITMLAMADRHGYVGASVPGLAHRARVTTEEADAALAKFLAPDPYSRSQEHEGRRIEVADRGWALLNYERFRDMRDEEARKEYERHRKREQRAATRASVTVTPGVTADDVPDSPGQSRNVPGCLPVSAQAEAEAELKAELEPQTHKPGEGVPGWVHDPPVPPGSVRPDPTRAALQDALQYGEAVPVPEGLRRLRVPAAFEEEHCGPLAEIIEELAIASERVTAGKMGVQFWRGTMLLTPNGYARMVGENAAYRKQQRKGGGKLEGADLEASRAAALVELKRLQEEDDHDANT
jgi:hypothetical protein